MNITQRTAEDHSRHIRDKLGCEHLEQVTGGLSKSILMDLLLSDRHFNEG